MRDFDHAQQIAWVLAEKLQKLGQLSAGHNLQPFTDIVEAVFIELLGI